MLDGPLVRRVCGADKMIVAGSHQVPDFFNLSGYPIYIFLGGNACLSGKVFYFLPVLIGAGHEKHIISPLPLVPGDTVGHDDFIGIAKMGLLRGVGNGGRYIEFFFFHNILQK